LFRGGGWTAAVLGGVVRGTGGQLVPAAPSLFASGVAAAGSQSLLALAPVPGCLGRSWAGPAEEESPPRGAAAPVRRADVGKRQQRENSRLRAVVGGGRAPAAGAGSVRAGGWGTAPARGAAAVCPSPPCRECSRSRVAAHRTTVLVFCCHRSVFMAALCV